MTVNLDRRRLIIGGAFGLGSLLLPLGSGIASAQAAARGFTHNVASGEPGPESMLLWTRYVPAADTDVTHLEVQVAADRGFRRIIAGGSVHTGAWRDWTAKISVDGLQPGTIYWYRFVAADGSTSPVGRTRTLPVGDVSHFGLGVFSCSNIPVGWFNAYAHASERDDLDLWMHAGDYIYEYGIASYRTADIVAERELMPAHEHEMIALADYRLRLACYRSDPDLQRLHQMVPMVALWDDHESANDSWEGGAQNHQPAREGDWSSRRAASIQAYREWLPVSEEPWKAYSIGTLATLYRSESRLLARTRPLDSQLAEAHRASNPDAALAAFRDGMWQDPTRTMLGTEQEHWFAQELRKNARSSIWQLVGMATIMGRTLMPEEAVGMLHSHASEGTVAAFKRHVHGASLGLPMWMDRWDGYPAARSRFLRAAQQADANLVMLSGDSHNAWAYSLMEDGQPAGVEFAVQGVTSGGIEGSLGGDPKKVALAFMERNPELVWGNTHQRGYLKLNITAEQVTSEWYFLDSIKTRSTALAGTHHMTVDRDRRQLKRG